jgi:hypothetical protein
MNVTKLSFVPLQQASLCLDCDMITAGHTHCFACGSVALLNIARTLNGEEHTHMAPQGLTRVASIASGRGFKLRYVAVKGSRHRLTHFVDEYVPSWQDARGSGTDGQNPNWWYSLREVAAVVQRAMTVVLIGIFALVGGTHVSG